MAPSPTPAPSSRHSTPKASSRPATPARRIVLPDHLSQAEVNELLAKKVDFIAVTGVETKIEHPEKKHLRKKQKLLHWRVHASWFLDDKTNKSYDKRKSASVVFDTYKEDVNPTNVWIDLDYKSNFTFSKNTPSNAWWAGMTKTPITVKDIWNLVQHKNRHYYHYDENKSGCLYWSKTLLGDLEGQKWVEEGAVRGLEQVIDGLRQQDKYWVPDDKGTFFK